MTPDQIKYLAGAIADELSGSENYIRQAMDHKATDPEISKIFLQMADQEAGHAQNLYKICSMLRNTCAENAGLDLALDLIHDMLNDGLIRYNSMKQLYNV